MTNYEKGGQGAFRAARVVADKLNEERLERSKYDHSQRVVTAKEALKRLKEQSHGR